MTDDDKTKGVISIVSSTPPPEKVLTREEQEQELTDNILDCIYDSGDEISGVAVIGILELVYDAIISPDEYEED